jgi:hypothetical protein
MNRPLNLLLLIPLTGCLGSVCADADAMQDGDVEGKVDGVRWDSQGVQWMHPGQSLQITTDSDDGWRVTIVARTTDEGRDVVDGLEDNAFPMRVELNSALEGGWALLYPSTGGAYTTEEGAGGALRLDGFDDDTLIGCFEFEAGNGTQTVSLKKGVFRAEPYDSE